MPAACHTDRPLRRCQDCAGLSSPAVKNAIRLRQRKGTPDDGLEAGFRHAQLGAHHGSLLGIELGELRVQPGRDRDRLRALGPRVLEDLRRDLAGALVDVGDEQHRLGGERRQQCHRVGRVGRWRHGPGGLPGLQGLDQPAQPVGLGDRAPVAALGGLRHPLEAPLGLLEIGVDQLGLDRLDVGERVDPSLGMDDVRVVVDPDDVDDRVGLADVREELVAEALAAVGARDQARRCRGRRSCPGRSSTP